MRKAGESASQSRQPPSSVPLASPLSVSVNASERAAWQGSRGTGPRATAQSSAWAARRATAAGRRGSESLGDWMRMRWGRSAGFPLASCAKPMGMGRAFADGAGVDARLEMGREVESTRDGSSPVTFHLPDVAKAQLPVCRGHRFKWKMRMSATRRQQHVATSVRYAGIWK